MCAYPLLLHTYVRTYVFQAMSLGDAAQTSSSAGYQLQKKKRKLLQREADRGEQYLCPVQPGRVPLNKISWHPLNRGGQGIMPLHAHEVAKDVMVMSDWFSCLTPKKKRGSQALEKRSN